MHTLPLLPPMFAELPEGFYSRVKPQPLAQPHWIAVNRDLAGILGLDMEDFQTACHLAYLSGSAEHYEPQPLATVYSGHQFGGYTPRLGDGRALLLGDSVDRNGQRWEWQLKGAGKTPYSRFADGRAVLRSSIREYLCSEAMHGLGIPTTRALALTGSADEVYREEVETAAVLTRLAPSFIRFGHFEYLFYRGREAELKQLADFVIRHYYPDCLHAGQPYLSLLREIGLRTAATVAAWQSVGFCHGVMNTDNMSVLGLTIDYGPFGFLDAYDGNHVCNHSDTQGRYAYRAQPYVAHWNMAALAACFESLVSEDELNSELDRWPDYFQTAYLKNMRLKLGLSEERAEDAALVGGLWEVLQGKNVDFTLFFRGLAKVGHEADAVSLQNFSRLFEGGATQDGIGWLHRYRHRLRQEHCPTVEREQRMNQANPAYVLRNYLAEQAIGRAKQGDYGEIDRLFRCLKNPYEEKAEYADFLQTPPEWSREIQISCSS